ncbi:MAG TPA: hypothetical protein DEP53_08395 [Bacteroidetes bacterium]|nr:hypothetical protein [Bacteroidota bacterium]
MSEKKDLSQGVDWKQIDRRQTVPWMPDRQENWILRSGCRGSTSSTQRNSKENAENLSQIQEMGSRWGSLMQ